MQLLICTIYGDRTIIGFVGFVVNLLNRPTDGATVNVRKSVTFRQLVSKIMVLIFKNCNFNKFPILT
jgi:hypothetical protein